MPQGIKAAIKGLKNRREARQMSRWRADQTSVTGGARACAVAHTCNGVGAFRNKEGTSSPGKSKQAMACATGGKPKWSACRVHSGQWSIFILLDESSGACLKTRMDGKPSRLTHISIDGKNMTFDVASQRDTVGANALSRMAHEAAQMIQRCLTKCDCMCHSLRHTCFGL